MKLEVLEIFGESEPEIRNTQDLASWLSGALMEVASASDVELEMSCITGELSDPDGGTISSTFMDSIAGSIGLIGDRQGDMWLACWIPGQEAGQVRQVGLGDSLDELINFCIAVVQRKGLRRKIID